SAVFSPMPGLGLVIVDEEHEHTFKQESCPRYHGRDLAVMRAAAEKAVVVLGSATPSLESWHNAQTGKYQLLSLTERPGGARVPEARVVDMGEECREQKRLVTFSRELLARLGECLQKKQQAILFLNRRGFNTEVRCKACGETLKCQDCSIALTYHKHDGLMRCHYCDAAARPPDKCPTCGARALRFSGTGTERAEAVLQELFPEARLLRMDSDTMTRRDAHGRALAAFAAGEYDVLLGTQMVTKGFDFPNVTLVGVLAADSAIDLPDFRAAERTFQLVTQVVGRAGRAEKSGVAVIQAFQPGHYAVQYALRQDFPGFAAYELQARRALGYPPYGRLARIIVASENEAAARGLGDQIAARLKTVAPEPGRVLGPAPCVIEKLQKVFRFHLLVMARDHRALRRVLDAAAEFYAPARNGVQVTLDVDPVSMM
ncbi:MAG: primosomal protein N', partial [Planctomycetes bacterium]|nr:primosomal protein N' [Planctomycetota bacterium]